MRKLLDHLLSHRNKVADCLAYNLRLATQTHALPRKLAGLLIVDEITTQLSRTAKPDIDDGMTLTRTGSSQARLAEEGQGRGGGGEGRADLRLDLAYFRLVVHLLESEKDRAVVWAVLGSISNYCEGRKERFACRAEVWRTLELLLDQLRSDGAEQAARCYLQLL